MEKLEFFKELYEKQLESKESLANRFTMIISIVTLLFGGLFYCLKNINDLENYPILFWTLILFATVSLIFDVIIMFLLLKHFRGEEYDVLPRPKELAAHYENLETHAAKYPIPNVTAEDYFNDYQCESYIKAADHNFDVNNERIYCLNRVHTLIIISAMLTMLSLACYVPYFFYDDANTQKVEITKTPEINNQEVPDVKKSPEQPGVKYTHQP